jgi:hypothetical protein
MADMKQEIDARKKVEEAGCKQVSEGKVTFLKAEIDKHSGFGAVLMRMRQLDPFGLEREVLRKKLGEEQAKENACLATAERRATEYVTDKPKR